MCEICTFKELENCNTIETGSLKTGLGEDASLHVTLWSEKDDNNKHSMRVTLETQYGEGLIEIGFAMDYCPKCGIKLNP